MARIKRWLTRWAAQSVRRAEARSSSSISRAARDVIGPQGALFSNAWEELDRHGQDYVDSFDRRLPPSIFVSERDRLRMNQPMPLAERCIEDFHRR